MAGKNALAAAVASAKMMLAHLALFATPYCAKIVITIVAFAKMIFAANIAPIHAQIAAIRYAIIAALGATIAKIFSAPIVSKSMTKMGRKIAAEIISVVNAPRLDKKMRTTTTRQPTKHRTPTN